MLLALYEIRNNRNVGHVGADVDPNHTDASVVLSMAKWMIGELGRIFHGTTTDEAMKVVEELTDRTVPLLWKVGDRVRVIGSKLSARDKMLVVLYGRAAAMDARELAETIEYGNLSKFRKEILQHAHKDDLVYYDKSTDSVVLSPIGVRHVEEEIPLEV
jgi:hypothetical protein